MDAPRARAQYVSYPFLEEVKDGKINTPKYKSKTVYLTKRPHVFVMMNEFPQKNLNEKGLSEDRYTYLVIDDNGEDAEWFQGFRDPSSFDQPTAYEIVQSTIQSRLPNNLQDNLNRAFKSCFCQTEQEASAETICQALTNAIQTWSKSPF